MLRQTALGTLSLTVTGFGAHPFTTTDGRTESALSWITFTGRACTPADPALAARAFNLSRAV